MNTIPASAETVAPLNIGILGTGALGSLMAYHWQQQHLVALPRNRHSNTELAVENRAGELWQSCLPAWTGEPLDWLVVCTKAAATLTALKSWQHFLPKVQRIVLLQNGMGQQDECAAWLSQQHLPCELWAGMSTEGAYKEHSNSAAARVIYAGQGETFIGPWQTDLNISCAPLPNTQIVADIHARLRAKLAVNAVINPLTAFFKCPNGELLTNPVYRQQLDALTAEVAQLYRALNWPLSSNLASDLASIVNSVAEKTAQNKSSTLQDILNKRPTELPYICGYLLHQAQQVGVAMPITEQILQQLNTDRRSF